MQYRKHWCRWCIVMLVSLSCSTKTVVVSGGQYLVFILAIALLPFEFLAAHWAEAFAAVLLDPGEEAMHMEAMATLSNHCRRQVFARPAESRGGLTESAVIAREFASRTSAIELNTTNTTNFIVGHIPPPSGDGVPGLDDDLHGCDQGL
jgi:hypothetical protein